MPDIAPAPVVLNDSLQDFIMTVNESAAYLRITTRTVHQMISMTVYLEISR